MRIVCKPTRNLRFASTSEMLEKVVPPERQLSLMKLENPESLSVHLGTWRLSGVSTQLGGKIISDVMQILRKDKNCRKFR
jgi:hypothetical protein